MGLIKHRIGNYLLRRKYGGRDLHPHALGNLAALDGLDPERPLAETGFVVLDLETTGMDAATDRVVSLGAVRIREGRIRLGDSFFELVNPRRDIPAEAIKVHGITPDMIAEARHGALVVEDFLGFLGRDVLVAHYARFDVSILNRVMQERYGFPLQNLVLDTVLMCEGVIMPSDPYGISRDKSRCSLEALAGRFGLRLPERHTAMGDALTTAMIFQRMTARLEETGGTRLKDLMKVALLD